MRKRQKRRFIILAAGVFAVGAGFGVFKGVRSLQKSRLAEHSRAEGLAAFERGDMEGAIEGFRYAVQHDGRDIEAYLAFAEAREKVPLLDGRHLIDAIGLYKHTLMLLGEDAAYPDRAVHRLAARHRLIELYGLVGLRFEQIQMADLVLAGDPDDIPALAARAEAKFVERDFTASAADTRRLITLEPEVLRWRHLDLELMRRQGVDEQIMLDRCRQWAAAHDGDGRYQLLEAGVLIEARRAQEARELLREAAARGADTLEVLEMLVAMLDGVELRDVAGEVIVRAKTRFTDAQWVREAIVRRAWQGDAIETALAEVAEARREFGTLDPGLLRLEALCLAAAKRTDEARESLAKLRARDTDGEAAARTVAWADAIEAWLDAAVQGRTVALETIDHAIALDPNNAVMHMVRGHVLAANGETALADAAYQAALELDPNWIAAGLAHARALMTLGRPEQALAVSRHVLRRADSAALAPYITYAESLVAVLAAGGNVNTHDALLDHSGSVITVFEAIREQKPDEPSVAALLVEMQARSGRRGEATALIDEVLSGQHASGPMLLALAEASRRHGLGRAETLTARAGAAGADSADIALARARQVAARDLDAALGIVDEAIAAAGPEAARRLVHARIILLLETDPDRGQQTLAAYARQWPDMVDAQAFVLGRPQAWTNRTLVAGAVDRLTALLGPEAHRVRLARARMLVRFEADNEAQLAEATMTLAEILDETPDSLVALTLMAEASLVGAHPSAQRAIEHLERAVAAAPSREDLYPRLIALLQDQGDFEAAGRYLQRLGSVAVRAADSRRAELFLLQQQGDFEAALVRASVMFRDSDDLTDQLLLASMHRRAGRVDEAEAIYTRLLADDGHGGDLMVFAEASAFFAGTGRFAGGLQVLMDAPDDADRSMLIALYHLHHGRAADAAPWTERALTQAPESAEVRHVAARYHLAREERAAARDHAVAGLRLDRDHVGLRGTLALASLSPDGAGRGDAIDALRELGEGHEDLVALLELIERIPVRDGRLVVSDAILEDARRLVEAHGTLLATWSAATRLHAQAGRDEDAVEIARRAVWRFPANPEPAQWATELLLEAGRFAEALSEAEEWRRRSLGDPLAADVTIARTLLQQNRALDAVTRLEPHAARLVHESEQHPRRLAVWLQSLLGAGQVELAARTVRPLLARSDLWRTEWFGLALRLNDDDAAVALEALETYVGDEAERLRLAGAWYQLGRRTGESMHYDAARRHAAAIEDPALSLDALDLLGSIAVGSGLFDVAIMLYEEALASNPEHPVVLNNLANALLHAGRHEAALPHAEKAMKLLPEHPDVLDTYAQVLAATGELREAEAAIRQARSLRPDDPSIMLTLAEILYEQDERAKAEIELGAARRAMNASPPSKAVRVRANTLEGKLRQRSAGVE